MGDILVCKKKKNEDACCPNRMAEVHPICNSVREAVNWIPLLLHNNMVKIGTCGCHLSSKYGSVLALRSWIVNMEFFFFPLPIGFQMKRQPEELKWESRNICGLASKRSTESIWGDLRIVQKHIEWAQQLQWLCGLKLFPQNRNSGTIRYWLAWYIGMLS